VDRAGTPIPEGHTSKIPEAQNLLDPSGTSSPPEHGGNASPPLQENHSFGLSLLPPSPGRVGSTEQGSGPQITSLLGTQIQDQTVKPRYYIQKFLQNGA
jgi:hypothetical protein